jgi:hypothetical protein
LRSTIIKDKVAADRTFDSTLVNSRKGIDNDLNDAFGDTVAKKDSAVRR